MLKKYYIYPVLLITLSSCFVLKKTTVTGKENEKNTMQFVFYFDEANKNRLNGNINKAEENYLTALSFNNKSAVSFYYLAKISIEKKDLISAQSYSEKSIALQNDNFWYQLLYADILKLNGNNEKAVSLYEQLLNIFPKEEIPYNRLIQIFENEHNNKKLIYVYEKKQKNYDYEPETDVKLFNLFIIEKDFPSAEKILKRLRTKYTDNYRYAGMAAEYYYSTGKIEKAEKIYHKLLTQNPENTDVLLSYALFCTKNMNNDKYYKLTKKLLNSDLDFYKKTQFLITGRYPNFPKTQYFELLNNLYKHHPDEVIANTMFAEYYLDENNKKDALPYIRKAAFINPENFNIVMMLFSLSYDTKDFKNLSADTEKFLKLYPNKPQIYFYKGIAEYNLQNYKTAEKFLKIGKNLIIDDKELEDQFYFYLCLTYKKTDKIKKALSFAEKLINDKNKDIKIFELYGDLLFLDNQKDKALMYWNKAKDNGNNSKNLLYKIEHFTKLTKDDVKN